MFTSIKHPVILLPCNASPLGYNDENKLDLSTNYGFDAFNTKNNFRHKPIQILIVTKTDDVFPDDYVLNFNSIEKVQGVDDDDYYVNNKSVKYSKNDIQKILAIYPKYEDLPSISISFIKRWIKNTSTEIYVNYSQLYHPINMNNIREIKWGVIFDQKNEISCRLLDDDEYNPMVINIRPIDELVRDYCFNIHEFTGTTNYDIEDMISACLDFAMSDDVKEYWFREFNKRKQC
jgi:hypothetical protein